MLGSIGAYVGRHHLALVALFFAVGGASVATAAALAPRNSVGSPQVINGSLKLVDLAARTKTNLRVVSGRSRDDLSVAGQSPVPQTTNDAAMITTTRRGRLLVSKTVSSVTGTCTPSSTWHMWLMIDDQFIPGTSVVLLPSGTTLRAVTLTGVTRTAIPAGEHTVEVAFKCVAAGSSFSPSITLARSATVVVLG